MHTTGNAQKESAALTQYVIITSDAISLQVNPLQCGYFCQLVGKDGEVVISQIDAGQMLHAGHSVRQFGEHISLKVQFCNTFSRHCGKGAMSTMCDWMFSVFSKKMFSSHFLPLSPEKMVKNFPERTFILLWAKVMKRMLCATLLRTLKTPSGKETSLQSDRSAEGRAWLVPFTQQQNVCILQKKVVWQLISPKNLKQHF